LRRDTVLAKPPHDGVAAQSLSSRWEGEPEEDPLTADEESEA
jgi:hypothetical protein